MNAENQKLKNNFGPSLAPSEKVGNLARSTCYVEKHFSWSETTLLQDDQ